MEFKVASLLCFWKRNKNSHHHSALYLLPSRWQSHLLLCWYNSTDAINLNSVSNLIDDRISVLVSSMNKRKQRCEIYLLFGFLQTIRNVVLLTCKMFQNWFLVLILTTFDMDKKWALNRCGQFLARGRWKGQ